MKSLEVYKPVLILFNPLSAKHLIHLASSPQASSYYECRFEFGDWPLQVLWWALGRLGLPRRARAGGHDAVAIA